MGTQPTHALNQQPAQTQDQGLSQAQASAQSDVEMATESSVDSAHSPLTAQVALPGRAVCADLLMFPLLEMGEAVHKKLGRQYMRKWAGGTSTHCFRQQYGMLWEIDCLDLSKALST